MRKIGIINCFKMSNKCSAGNCFNSLKNGIDSFEKYKEEGHEIVGLGHCNVCCNNPVEDILIRAESLRKSGADSIHVSSCIKLNCRHYDEFMKLLNNNGYDSVGYTHAIR